MGSRALLFLLLSKHSKCHSLEILKLILYILQYIEIIAISLKWPKELWTQLLQWKLVGKAQEVYSLLSLFENINTVKAAIPCVHELVPEAYHQNI